MEGLLIVGIYIPAVIGFVTMRLILSRDFKEVYKRQVDESIIEMGNIIK